MKTQIKLMQVKKHGILKTLLLKIIGKYPAYKNILMNAENVDTVQLRGEKTIIGTYKTIKGVYKGNGVYEFEVKKPGEYTLHVNGIEQSEWTNVFIPGDVKI